MLVAVLCGILCCVFLAVVVLILRVLLVLRRGTECKPGEKGSVCVLVVAGSGGHTTEIIRLMGSLSQSYTPRHYVMADTDKMSEDKIRAFEASKQKGNIPQEFTIHRIPRSREVRQSWSSSVHSTLYALVYSVPLVFRLRPDVTCIFLAEDPNGLFTAWPALIPNALRFQYTSAGIHRAGFSLSLLGDNDLMPE
ncbi:UDP-N-acetylglucosamine transferase subunit ALG14 homolog isoform X3 [Electrophorus electricus]|uniref:UDP-N-acetylglucosamine transferase subunit ALG14 homolog isoform X3 n=1 Tax=Electrophorus electricus TaxID=8005 RepID=UPI000F0A4CB1|nr:UDP-N-acetylglucosamine transferase subunit ALG14 homolog isoform X3 [Electrophorus electricus]